MTQTLQSWDEDGVKQAILDYVTTVNTPGSKDFVPPADRITSFNNPASENRKP